MLGHQLIIATIISLLFSGGSASACRMKHNTNLQVNKPSMPQDESNTSLKVLVEGFHSSITNPFVAVIRDEETYLALNRLEGNLPKLDEDFFKSNVVVAAFLGTRNTGGYRVEITREGIGGIRVAEKKPGKGLMLPQMITSPFKAVSVSISVVSPIVLKTDEAWNRPSHSYLVTDGTFTMSGGFAGKVEKFAVEGKLSVSREGSLATFSLQLKNAGETNEHLLLEVATGFIESSGIIMINKFSAFTFINQPNSGLKANGGLSDHEHKLTLEIMSLPSVIADGYSGSGRIESILIGSVQNP